MPNSIKEVDDFLKKLAKHLQTIDVAEGAMNKEITAAKEKAEKTVQPHREVINDMFAGIFLFAESNREVLTENGKIKSVKRPAGIFGWRTNPGHVSISGKIKTIIERILSAGLGEMFLRMEPELNKEAMLEKPDVAETIKGIKIKREEMFFVKFPAETVTQKNKDGEIEQDVDKLQKKYAV